MKLFNKGVLASNDRYGIRIIATDKWVFLANGEVFNTDSLAVAFAQLAEYNRCGYSRREGDEKTYEIAKFKQEIAL